MMVCRKDSTDRLTCRTRFSLSTSMDMFSWLVNRVFKDRAMRIPITRAVTVK